MPRTPLNDAANPSRPPARLWPTVGGPLLTLATLIALLGLAPTPWRIPYPAIVYFIPVIYSAYVGGLGPGLVSAAMSLVFSLIFFSRPGHLLEYTAEDVRRLEAIFLVTPVITVMTGMLKRREQRLSWAAAAVRADERYRALVEDIDGIVWEADPVTFEFSFVGGRALSLLGYPPPQWLGEPGFWANHIHPDDRERSVAFCVASVARGEDHTFDYRMVAADGRSVWMRDRVSLVKDLDGKVTLLRGVMTDFTASVQAEQAQRSSEALKAAIVEGALDCIVTMDHRGNITDFNPAAERTFGYRRADVIGRSMADLIVPPALRQAHRAGLARHLATGEARILGKRLELQAMRADGSEFPVELAIDRIPGIEPPMFTGFIRDVTERRRADDAQRGTLSLLAATLESTTDGILVVDHEGRIVSFNRRFAAMWGIPPEILDARDDDQAIAFVLSQLRTPELFVAKVRELYAQPDAESFDELEFMDGRVFERYSMPQRIEDRSVGRVWSFRDVTERRRAEVALRDSEERLRQSQKMDAIGRLAGGVAHDFNNLLTVILGYSEQILERLQLPADESTRRAAAEIRSAAERAAGLTGQLLAFSRKQMLKPTELDLNLTLTGTTRLLRRLIGEDITLDVKLEPDLGLVHADEGQIQQVIMNLAINARDAMPNGGRLTLTTANAELDATYAQHHAPLTPGRYVMLTVNDTGTGMDPETRARAFEPFFTTKEQGKGTGLGLSTVYGIVKQSGGYIWVYSEPGAGTAFKIYLPRLDAPLSGPEAVSVPGRLQTGTETVLLVEDETMVRNLLAGMMERSGYRMLTAASGEEAANVAANYQGPIHLMVTDVVMPGIGGPELAQRLAPFHPELKVLFISGYTDDAVLRHGVREGVASFLQKPFTLVALARKMREVLDSRQTA
jgi:PAS domain S-box-containing protein